MCACFSITGEHIRNWRQRYFFLREDGSLTGYKTKPEDVPTLTDPLNNFTVRGCQVLKTDKPKVREHTAVIDPTKSLT